MARQRTKALASVGQIIYVMIDGSGAPTGHAYLDKNLADRHERLEEEVVAFQATIRDSLPDDLSDESE